MNYAAFDAADYLDNEDAIAAYLNAVIAEGDTDLFLAALSDIARARGMSRLAEDSGLARESLYRALRPGSKPRFETVHKILQALHITIAAAPAQRASSMPPAH